MRASRASMSSVPNSFARSPVNRGPIMSALDKCDGFPKMPTLFHSPCGKTKRPSPHLFFSAAIRLPISKLVPVRHMSAPIGHIFWSNAIWVSEISFLKSSVEIRPLFPAPDARPNLHFGRHCLGSCGPWAVINDARDTLWQTEMGRLHLMLTIHGVAQR